MAAEIGGSSVERISDNEFVVCPKGSNYDGQGTAARINLVISLIFILL